MEKKVEKMINEVRKHINFLEHHRRGEIRTKEKYQELKRSIT